MHGSMKTIAISAAVGLVVGLVIGFLPTHSANARLQDQNASLTRAQAGTQSQLNLSQQRLQLSNLAVQSAGVASQALSNNYSVASSNASSLFTNLRKYVDDSPDNQATQQIKEVLGVRDRVITDLAQANPAVKPVLQQVFTKLERVAASANQSD